MGLAAFPIEKSGVPPRIEETMTITSKHEPIGGASVCHDPEDKEYTTASTQTSEPAPTTYGEMNPP